MFFDRFFQVKAAGLRLRLLLLLAVASVSCSVAADPQIRLDHKVARDGTAIIESPLDGAVEFAPAGAITDPETSVWPVTNGTS